MSARGVSSRREIERMAMEGDPETVPAKAQETGVGSDAEIAEERGAERLRTRLREMLEDRRRVVRLGEQQIEVVEVSAVEDVLAERSEEAGS
jgi:hypothetical protein